MPRALRGDFMRPVVGASLFAGLTVVVFGVALSAYLYQKHENHWQDTEARLDLLLRENIIAVDLLFEEHRRLAASIAHERVIVPTNTSFWTFEGGSGGDTCFQSGQLGPSKMPDDREIYVGPASIVDDDLEQISAPIYFRLGQELIGGICVDISRIFLWWQSIEWPAGAAVALIRDRRDILIRRPFRKNLLNKDISAGPLIHAILQTGPDVGVADFTATMTDNVVRRVAWRASSITNLSLVAGFSRNTVTALWWKQAQPAAFTVSIVGFLVAIFVFITVMNQARSRENLALSEARLKAATEGGGMGVWDYDPSVRSLHWDPGMFQLYRVGKDQFPGVYEAWRATVHPEDLVAAEDKLNEAIEKQIPFDNEFRILLPDGSNRWLKAEARLFTDQQGNVQRMIGVNRDITSEVLAREEVEAARESAERANAAKSEFLAAMSHELRTPLNAICGFSEMLTREVFGSLGNEKYRDYVKHVNTSARHLMSLVNNVLDLSRIEAGEMPLVIERVDIVAIIRECIFHVGYKNERTADDVSLHFGSEQIFVDVDAQAIRQILINLLANSDKYTPANGDISIEARQSASGETTIMIKDTGIGIPNEDIDLVLEPFRQARRSVELAHEGTGLGLSLSAKLMSLMGGELEIDSVERLGTAIILRFPGTQPSGDV